MWAPDGAGRGVCQPPQFVLPDSDSLVVPDPDPVPTVGRGTGAATATRHPKSPLTTNPRGQKAGCSN